MKDSPLIRIVTIGSVDDGKSTLLGRLLFETKSIYDDQYEAIKKASFKKGTEIDLSFLLDGLAAEREQAITIDVAYRYFTINKKRIIVADCPGHEQYTRNMVTGASTAHMAFLLLDAKKGLLSQSKRHAFLVSLLGVKNIIVVINKMDTVDYSEEVFKGIVSEFSEFSKGFNSSLAFIPVSAINGDNIVKKSRKTPWYTGKTVLDHIDKIKPESHISSNFRFPVQNVIRPSADFRGFAGRVISGKIAKDDEIIVFPSRKIGRIKSLLTYNGEIPEAGYNDSVVITLNRELDISRGDLLVSKEDTIQGCKFFSAYLCWMGEKRSATNYILKHTTGYANVCMKVTHKIDIENLGQEQCGSLDLNDIGIVEINTPRELYLEPYNLNRSMGNFILIDPITNSTVAAGMVMRCLRAEAAPEKYAKKYRLGRELDTLKNTKDSGRDMLIYRWVLKDNIPYRKYAQALVLLKMVRDEEHSLGY